MISKKNILFITDCIAFPYFNNNSEEITLWMRARSNTVVRFLNEGQDFKNKFNTNAENIKSKYNLEVAKIPDIDKNSVEILLMTALMDEVQTTYLVDGCSLSPEAMSNADWPGFLRDYSKEQPLPVDQIIKNFTEIASQFPNAKKGLILHHSHRLPEKEEYWKKRIIDITIASIHNLPYKGWEIFPLPADAPPMENDNYWSHFDGMWAVKFVGSCLNKLKSRE